MTAKSLLVKIGADVADFNQKIDGSKKKLKDLSEGMTKIGKGLTAAVTLPLVGIGIAAFKMSNDFNAAMADVATLIPGTGDRVNDLKKEVQDLAVKTGKSTKDMAAGLYQVISALGDSSDSMKILETSAKAGRAGLATTLDAVNLLTAVTKGYGDTSKEAATKAADLAFQTVKLGQTTFPQLAASIGRVVPIAATLKVSQEELFAGFATLTGVTGDAAEVSTQLAAILRAMLKPTEDMKASVEALGYSSAGAMLQEEGLVGALRSLMGTTDGTEESVAKLLGRAESLTAVFALTGGQADTFDSKLKELNKSTGAMDEAFRISTEGVNKTGFAWDQFKTKLEVTAQKLGDTLAPAFTRAIDFVSPLIDKIQKLTEWFSNLSPPVKTVIMVLAGVAAAAGPTLIILAKMLPVLRAIRQQNILTGASFSKLAQGALVAYVAYETLRRLKDLVTSEGRATTEAMVQNARDLADKMGGMQGFFDEAMKRGIITPIQKVKILAGVATASISNNLRGWASEWGTVWEGIASGTQGEKLQALLKELAGENYALAESAKAYIEAGKASGDMMAKVGDEAKKMVEEIAAAAGESGKPVVVLTDEQKKAIAASVEEMKKLRLEMVNDVAKASMSEYQYTQFSLDQQYQARRDDIQKSLVSTQEKNALLLQAQQAYNAQSLAFDAQQGIAMIEQAMQQRTAWIQVQKDAQAEYLTLRQDLQTQMLQLGTMGLEQELALMEIEKAAKAKAYQDDKLLNDTQKKELIAMLEIYYADKKALAEADASGELELISTTYSTMKGLIDDFCLGALDAFYKWGEGSEKILGTLGDTISDWGKKALHGVMDIASGVASGAAKEILAAKAAAIAHAIKSVMASIPFPLNIALVGGAIAAVSALFHKIHLGEGGLVTRPTTALIGEKGPELVVPLKKLGLLRAGAQGQGLTLQQTLHFHGNINSSYSVDEISRILGERTVQAIQKGRRF